MYWTGLPIASIIIRSVFLLRSPTLIRGFALLDEAAPPLPPRRLSLACRLAALIMFALFSMQALSAGAAKDSRLFGPLPLDSIVGRRGGSSPLVLDGPRPANPALAADGRVRPARVLSEPDERVRPPGF